MHNVRRNFMSNRYRNEGQRERRGRPYYEATTVRYFTFFQILYDIIANIYLHVIIYPLNLGF